MVSAAITMKSAPIFLPLALGSLLFAACGKKQSSNTETDEPLQFDMVDSGSAAVATPTTPTGPNKPTGFTAEYQDILAKVNAQCPQDYPEIVTPLPDFYELETMSSEQLMGLLESWNPVQRMNAAKALGTRGADAIADLRKGTHSDNNKVRAGSATALAAICRAIPRDQIPEDLVNDFIRLTTDPEHEVRVAALKALGTLAPKTREATLAVLAMTVDPDEYLAQDAMVTLNKYFEAYKLPIEDIEPGLKAAMKGPLPNGKGHIVTIMSKLKPMDQRRFIPELLAHLDWYTRRDTMFAGGGQELALKMLTKMEVPELVPRLPKLMGKKGRGMHLYTPSIESARALGAMSKPLYDELKAIYKQMEKLGKDAPITPDSRGDFKEGMDDLKRLLLELEAY